MDKLRNRKRISCYLFCSDEVCKLFLCTVSLLWRIHSLISNRTFTLISSLYSFSKGTGADIRSIPSAGHLSTGMHICACMSEFLGLPPPFLSLCTGKKGTGASKIPEQSLLPGLHVPGIRCHMIASLIIFHR